MRVPTCLDLAVAKLTSMALHTQFWLADHAYAIGVLARFQQSGSQSGIEVLDEGVRPCQLAACGIPARMQAS